MNFYVDLISELLASFKNNFSHKENYDEARFGKVEEGPVTLKGNLRKQMEKAFESKGYMLVQKQNGFAEWSIGELKILDPYFSRLEGFYNLLSDETSKKLLVKILAFRILGFTKVKLPLNTPDFWKGIQDIESVTDQSNYLESTFMDWHLPLVDLRKKGIPVQLYFNPTGAYLDFILKQYEFKNGTKTIKAEKGEYIIDAGGCWGDTAVYFANQVGESGKVFTYEFIPSNLAILEKNISLNPLLQERITLIKQPVWEISDQVMYYVDQGPGSRVFMQEEESYNGKVSSLSIDDLIVNNAIPKVDFIKMDIEGAEPYALKGAITTLRKFRPKLAIAIYHSMDDFVSIPKFINELDLGYELHLSHCSIHAEETILFAEIPSK